MTDQTRPVGVGFQIGIGVTVTPQARTTKISIEDFGSEVRIEFVADETFKAVVFFIIQIKVFGAIGDEIADFVVVVLQRAETGTNAQVESISIGCGECRRCRGEQTCCERFYESSWY